MKLFFEGQGYDLQTKNDELTASLRAMLPLRLKLSRSAEHEYYTTLPGTVSIGGAESTSHVEAGGVYYFKDWNAFSLNFKAIDIAPYKVYVVGTVSKEIVSSLMNAKSTIEIAIDD